MINLLDIKFFTFAIVSRRSGKRFEFTSFGKSRDEALARLLNGWLKNQNWGHWTLEDVQ